MSEEKLAAAAKLLANQIARGGAVREDACLEVLRTVIDLARDPAEGWECYGKEDIERHQRWVKMMAED